MPRTVAHESNQILVNILHIGLQYPTIFRFFPHDTGNNTDDELHDIDILFFVESAHIIDFADTAAFQYGIDSLSVVFHIEPVAHIVALTIDREFLTGQYILDNQRYQFFREMIGTVIVGTPGNIHRHAVGFVVSPHEHIGTRLRSRIRRTGIERCRLRKEPLAISMQVGTSGHHFAHIGIGNFQRLRVDIILRQRAVDLVGRYLQEFLSLGIERLPFGIFSLIPSLAGAIEHILRAQYIRFQEELRIGYTAVYVRFGRKIDHIIYIGFGKNVRYQFSIAYVPLHEPHSRIGYFVFNSTQIPGIRKFV